MQRRIGSLCGIEILADAACLYGIPENNRSDHGPEMIAEALRTWIAKTVSRLQFINPDFPWDSSSRKSFNESSNTSAGAKK